MRVILTGGGTGGHIYPAIAIGQAIREKWPQTEFLYIGTQKGLESSIVPQAGFTFQTIDVVGWQRRISWQAFQSVYKALAGLRKAAFMIREFKPDLVIGTGGYVCLPVIWAASRQNITTVLHEQNTVPGLTNKFLSSKVSSIMVTFSESARHFSDNVQNKIRLTGLPVRPAILSVNRFQGLQYFGFSPDLPVLLVSGGSRGAHSINSAMLGVYHWLKGNGTKLQVIHLTGSSEYEQVRKELASAGLDPADCGNIILRPYLHEIEYALACADLCIGRAGAAFIAELTARGIPAVLVPYPYAAGNHQDYNARSLADRGAAEIISDNELSERRLVEAVSEILADSVRRSEMARASKNAGNPEAISKIIKVLESLL